jgi:hypothetical protein
MRADRNVRATQANNNDKDFMGLQLQSMAIEMPPVARHPNRISFAGVLTMIDTPSDKAPSGARGHRVLLTKAATDRALPSLLGMALDYAPSLDRHDARRKVGIITSAEVLPGNTVKLQKPSLLQISGYLFAKDFPEIVREIRTRRRGGLGMSYEIADAHVDDPSASIWTVSDFTFTGAAILRREEAAYRETWIEISGQ